MPNTEITRESVLRKLKKIIGEKAAQAVCNARLWTIPNIEHILEFAGRNPEEIEKLIPVIQDIYRDDIEPEFSTDKDPLTLLDEAGYVAWYVKTEKEQNAIGGYFRSKKAVDHGLTGGQPRTNVGNSENGELLCTIYQNLDHGEKRFDDYYIIHAVRKDVLGDDKLPESQWHIKPSDHPEREDEYGRSVISIQILKTGGFISIKNRYNHTVRDPDATYNNNPDNIIPGLTYALQKHFKVSFNTTRAKMPENYRLIEDQFVHFNYELNNIYFDSDYYFSGSTITKINNDNQILFYCGFLLTMKKGDNRVESIAGEDTEFCDALNEYIHDKKVTVTKNKENGTKTVFVDGERFMDITKDGIITFLQTKNLNTVKIVEHHEYIKLSGDLDFSDVKHLELRNADLTSAASIKFNPNADSISFWGDLKSSEDLDFSGVRHLDLQNADLTTNGVKFNPNADHIRIAGGQKLSGDLDFSGVKNLDLRNADLTAVTSIKFNPNASTIWIGGGVKLSGDLDFSGVKYLDLRKADLTAVTSIKFNPNAITIWVSGGLKLSGDLDFSGVDGLSIERCDLTGVTGMKFKRNLSDVSFHGTKLSGDLDFSDIDPGSGFLEHADLTAVTSIKFPKNNALLQGAKLAGDWDFSGVNELDLTCADLTAVTSIKFPDKDNVVLKGVKLAGDWDFSDVKNLNLANADLTAVTSIKLPDNVNLKGVKLAGNWDFSDRENVWLVGADLTKVKSIKFNPRAAFVGTIVDPKKLDFEGTPYKVNLEEADLRNPVLNPLFNVKDGYVDLNYTKLSGDLDFSNVKNLNLNRADLSEVTSITITRKLYEQIKDTQVKFKTPDSYIQFQDLPKCGVKLKIQGRFAEAIKGIKTTILNRISHEHNQDNSVNTI